MYYRKFKISGFSLDINVKCSFGLDRVF